MAVELGVARPRRGVGIGDESATAVFVGVAPNLLHAHRETLARARRAHPRLTTCQVAELARIDKLGASQ